MYKFLLDEQGYFTGSYAEVGEIDGAIECEALPDTTDVLQYPCYMFINGAWQFDADKWAIMQAELVKVALRAKRENICFPVVNRGQLWYNTLTAEQLAELATWYQAWLDVTTTLIEPMILGWLD